MVLAGAGCASQKKARDQERQAYLAGQQQALMQAAQHARQQQGPAVFMQGPVRNQVVPWAEGLTLSQAIVQAEYTAFMNPLLVRVIRNGQIVAECKGIDLLHHQDMELQDGDTVLIVP
jgi:molybdopterin converting factor small subunit